MASCLFDILSVKVSSTTLRLCPLLVHSLLQRSFMRNTLWGTHAFTWQNGTSAAFAGSCSHFTCVNSRTDYCGKNSWVENEVEKTRDRSETNCSARSVTEIFTVLPQQSLSDVARHLYSTSTSPAEGAINTVVITWSLVWVTSQLQTYLFLWFVQNYSSHKEEMWFWRILILPRILEMDFNTDILSANKQS